MNWYFILNRHWNSKQSYVEKFHTLPICVLSQVWLAHWNRYLVSLFYYPGATGQLFCRFWWIFISALTGCSLWASSMTVCMSVCLSACLHCLWSYQLMWEWIKSITVFTLSVPLQSLFPNIVSYLVHLSNCPRRHAINNTSYSNNNNKYHGREEVSLRPTLESHTARIRNFEGLFLAHLQSTTFPSRR